MSALFAGAKSLPILPPLGLDMAGFVNREKPGLGYGEPMEVGALVVRDEQNLVALLTIDMAVVSVETADLIRKQTAEALGTQVDHVLCNINHSHALPAFPGDLKLGGDMKAFTPAENVFGDYVIEMVVSAARLAANSMVAVHVAYGNDRIEGLSVNRRERTTDGRTILGWNPEGPLDDSVQVARFDRIDGTTLCTLVNFACHPVVVGKEVPEYSSDYIGALRRVVRDVTKGECLFLQGAAGNILPLQGFFEYKGPEVEFGTKLGLKVLEISSRTESVPTAIRKKDFGSVTPISLYRREPDPSTITTSTVAAAEERVRFPLQALPTKDELESIIQECKQKIAEAIQRRDGISVTNPLQYHVQWAELILKRLQNGKVESYTVAPIQAIRIGDIALAAAPGEIFNEIGMAVKRQSPAKLTFYCGYSNGLVGYFASAEEYPYGGYEPSVSHRGFGLPANVAPECERILIDKGTALLRTLFPEE